MEKAGNNRETTEVRLRAVEPSDVDRLYLWENDRKIWPFGGTRAPMSRHQLWEYASNYDANPFSAGQLRLMIEVATDDGDDKGIATCGVLDLYDIDPVNSRTMVGIMVAPQWRGRGIAARALKAAGEYCRDTLALATIAAEVAADNLPSIKLFGEKAGYSAVGRRPSWYRRADRFADAVLFQKNLC